MLFGWYLCLRTSSSAEAALLKGEVAELKARLQEVVDATDLMVHLGRKADASGAGVFGDPSKEARTSTRNSIHAQLQAELQEEVHQSSL
mmetsp:Transcript_13485/g.23794  ORF Transcript_13485/g.23794 Transcript_13485/m.23794 type:complete len:89 (-) Transcript_13485:102-368(-)